MRRVLATKYHLPDGVPSAVASLLEGMLVLAPSDRLDVDELIASPQLASFGVTVPAEQPRSAEGLLTVSPPDGFDMMTCGSCDEPPHAAALATLDAAFHRGLRKLGLSSPLAKTLFWTLVYGGMCFAAVWTHLQVPGGSEQVFVLHEP